MWECGAVVGMAWAAGRCASGLRWQLPGRPSAWHLRLRPGIITCLGVNRGWTAGRDRSSRVARGCSCGSAGALSGVLFLPHVCPGLGLVAAGGRGGMIHATRLAGHERSAGHRPGSGLAGRDLAAVRRPRTRRRLAAQPVAADVGGPDARGRRRRVRRDSAHRRPEHPAAARFRRRRDLLLLGPDRRGLRVGRPASGPRDEGDPRRAARDGAAARGAANTPTRWCWARPSPSGRG